MTGTRERDRGFSAARRNVAVEEAKTMWVR